MERAERNGLSLQSQKGSTGLLFSVRILAPILDGGLRHIVLASIQYSLGRSTYMLSIVAEFTCRNLRRMDEATRSTAVAEIRAHLNRYGEQEPYPRLWHSLSRVLTSGKIKLHARSSHHEGRKPAGVVDWRRTVQGRFFYAAMSALIKLVSCSPVEPQIVQPSSGKRTHSKVKP